MARRGFSIGTVLLIGVICSILAFVVANLCTFQLNAAQQTQNSEQARDLAEGAIHMAVSRLHDGVVNNQPYGLHSETVTFQPLSEAPDRLGQVSFDTSTPWGYSTNNYDGTHNTGWNNTVVPQSSVHLVGHGVAGNSTQTIEVMVGLPRYQYVLAVDGPLQSAGPLLVKAEPSMAALAADPTLSSTLPGNAGSNTQVSAAAGSFVSGDLVCPGTVNLSSPSTVLGTVRDGSITMPYINIQNYNTSGPGTTVLSGTVTGPVNILTNTYASGPLTIQGDLIIGNATLYVNGGPLTINGGLSGTGAVFVDGSVILNGGADLDATNLVALLATGDVTLTGASMQKYFQGLVYTQGAFTANSITVAGAFVSANSPGSSGASALTLGPNVQVVSVPAAVSMAGAQATTSISALSPEDGITSLSTLLSTSNGQGYAMGTPSGSGWTPDGISATQPTNNSIWNAVLAAEGSNPYFQNFVLCGPGTPSYNANNQGAWSGGPNVNDIGCSWVGVEQTPNSPCYNIIVVATQYDSTSNQFVAVNPPQVAFCYSTSNSGFGLTQITQAQFDSAIAFTGYGSAGIVAAMEQAQQIYMTTANGLLGTTTTTTTTNATVPNLTLSNFYTDKDPVRILSWRER